MNFTDALNPFQQKAVETIEGPLLIIAGPGSGKTRVITHRIGYLINVCGVSPRRIMAVSFTNKAAKEMKSRLRDLLGHSAEEITMGTFHAICCQILRKDGKEIGIEPSFVIYDKDDQLDLLKQSLQDLNLDPKKYTPKALSSVISAAKSQLVSPDRYAELGTSYFDEIAQRVYARYQERLSQSNALDFDDLIMKTDYLFRSKTDVLSKYQSRYIHLLVDEFQDTNIAQYSLTKHVAGQYRNICVVGDPDQSIYSWRNADLRNILCFEKDYENASVVILEQNYRSSQTIIEAAASVIANNVQRKDKPLWTENDSGSPVAIVETYSEADEAQYVVREVENLIGRRNYSLADCAVLYRTNAQSRALEESFIRYGIPYQLVGALRFYDRRETKDIISYLRLVLNPHDNVSLTRIINVPTRGIGGRSVDELTRWANAMEVPLFIALEMLADEQTTTPLSKHAVSVLMGFHGLMKKMMDASEQLDVVELFDFIVEKSGYKAHLMDLDNAEDRWANVMELRTVANEFQGLGPQDGLARFLEGVALVSDVDSFNGKRDAVTLITLHQAKGLEFPVVFMVGMEEGVLPHVRSFDNPTQMEEERRLCYVGMTRAEKELYLVRAYRRCLAGGNNINPPSRFLDDVPTNLVKRITLFQGAESNPSSAKVSRASEVDVYPVDVPNMQVPSAGTQVHHESFGNGVVVSCKPTRNDWEIVINFKDAGKKKLLLSLAHLEAGNATDT